MNAIIELVATADADGAAIRPSADQVMADEPLRCFVIHHVGGAMFSVIFASSHSDACKLADEHLRLHGLDWNSVARSAEMLLDRGAFLLGGSGK